MALSPWILWMLTIPGQLDFFTHKPPPAPTLLAIEQEISRGLKTKVVSLEKCLSEAMEYQPRIQAAKASQRAAEAAHSGIYSLRGIARLMPDLSVRKKQADEGLEISQALLTKEVEDTKYAIRRAYFTVIYAGIQAGRIDRLIEALERTKKELGKDLVWWAIEESIGLNGKMRMTLSEAKNQLAVAQLGRLKARFLLSEEMGGLVALGYLPEPLDKTLLKPKMGLTLEHLETMVDEKGPERILARVGRDVARLEVEAQKRSSSFNFVNRTFAAFTDTGVAPIPTPDRGAEFRPGAINIEMSTFMGGPKSNRVLRAAALADRAEFTEQTATNLTRLEARVAFLTHREIERRLEAERASINDALKVYNRVTKSTIGFMDALLLTQGIQLMVDYEKLRFDQALIAADMMRMSGGSIEIPFEALGANEPMKDLAP